jgi:hypothetical protein
MLALHFYGVIWVPPPPLDLPVTMMPPQMVVPLRAVLVAAAMEWWTIG